LRLEASGELTDSAYKILESELSQRGVPIPQRGRPSISPQSLLAHWKGRARLSSAFWFLWVLGNFAFAIAKRIVGGEEGAAIGAVVSLIWIPYLVFAAVSVWRCAFNTGWKGWGYLARGTVVVNGISLVVLIVLEMFL
jgi:hypothetical protein